MWMLSTSRAELHYFTSPEDIPDDYAILSHVWDRKEQSFQDLQELQRRCSANGETPRDLADDKIRKCCELAESHGYKWVWIDTCCIDKTSSAELSEAINSMFRYYSRAAVCYAYLRDVSASHAFVGQNSIIVQLADDMWEETRNVSQFQNSQWHKRGWTLQELLAPRSLVLVADSWELLGYKVDLATELERATGIPAAVLRLEKPLTDYSIAQRMSWASKRRTTRVEDEAYCLLGVFDINIPTLYGEGRKAFQRLQEEIMRKYPDTTLFAWGPRSGNSTTMRLDSLFASSPHDFFYCADVHYEPALIGRVKATSRLSAMNIFSLGSRKPPRLVNFSMTPHGVLCRIPIAQYGRLALADLGWSAKDSGHRLFLVLTGLKPSIDRTDNEASRHTVYKVSRSIFVDQPELAGVEWSGMRWDEVYIVPHGDTAVGHVLPTIPLNHATHPPFQFPDQHILALSQSMLGSLVSVSNVAFPWMGHPPTTFTFRLNGVRWESGDSSVPVVIRVGRCSITSTTANEDSEESSENSSHDASLPPLWANVVWWTPPEYEQQHADVDSPPYHTCPDDHIPSWPGLSKSFFSSQYYDRETWEPRKLFRDVITLSFTVGPAHRGCPLVLSPSYRKASIAAP